MTEEAENNPYEAAPMHELQLAYRLITQQVKELTESIAVPVAKRKARLDAIEQEIRRRFNVSGEKSVTTDEGNFHVREKFTPMVKDWGIFYQHLTGRVIDGIDMDIDKRALIETRLETVFGAFHKKASAEYIQLWMQEHGGHFPAGADGMTERGIYYRKPTNK